MEKGWAGRSLACIVGYFSWLLLFLLPESWLGHLLGFDTWERLLPFLTLAASPLFPRRVPSLFPSKSLSSVYNCPIVGLS